MPNEDPNTLSRPPDSGRVAQAVNAIIAILRAQGFSGVGRGAITVALALREVKRFILSNTKAISGILLSVGLYAVVPSLAVALINLAGFTATGVLKASLAAFIQSVVYGANTGGIFSFFQSIGATAVIAPPVVLALGGLALIGGGYLWWYRRSGSGDGPGGSESGGDNGGPNGGGGCDRGEDTGDVDELVTERMALIRVRKY